jgi:2-iminobutanoate/2-iminopropanoate deaminase
MALAILPHQQNVPGKRRLARDRKLGAARVCKYSCRLLAHSLAAAAIVTLQGKFHEVRPSRSQRPIDRKIAMTRTIIVTTEAPKAPAAYSQAIKAAGLVFVSGTGPFHPVTGTVVEGGIGKQTAQCLTNISAILQAAGSSLGAIVSATFILWDEADFAGMNEEWLKWFPTNPPARQGAKLPIHPNGQLISIAVIAEAAN